MGIDFRCRVGIWKELIFLGNWCRLRDSNTRPHHYE